VITVHALKSVLWVREVRSFSFTFKGEKKIPFSEAKKRIALSISALVKINVHKGS